MSTLSAPRAGWNLRAPHLFLAPPNASQHTLHNEKKARHTIVKTALYQPPHLILVEALPEEEQLACHGVVEQQLLDAAGLIHLMGTEAIIQKDNTGMVDKWSVHVDTAVEISWGINEVNSTFLMLPALFT
jgi:hypothetical protein